MTDAYPTIGDCFWLKLKGFPRWPAKVCDPKDGGKEVQSERKANKVLLHSFGDHMYIWASQDALAPFEIADGEAAQKKASGKLKAALAQALSACRHPNPNRASRAKAAAADEAPKRGAPGASSSSDATEAGARRRRRQRPTPRSAAPSPSWRRRRARRRGGRRARRRRVVGCRAGGRPTAAASTAAPAAAAPAAAPRRRRRRPPARRHRRRRATTTRRTSRRWRRGAPGAAHGAPAPRAVAKNLLKAINDMVDHHERTCRSAPAAASRP